VADTRSNLFHEHRRSAGTSLADAQTAVERWAHVLETAASAAKVISGLDPARLVGSAGGRARCAFLQRIGDLDREATFCWIRYDAEHAASRA
jgi:hypothetical protein